MPQIRLLVSVAGDGPVVGSAGDVLTVDARTAKAWADGERAERVIDRSVPVETTEVVTSDPASRRGGPETPPTDGPRPTRR